MFLYTEDLTKGLSEDLAAELGTVIRYAYQASESFGLDDEPTPQSFDKPKTLKEMAADEAGHARELRRILKGL